MAGCHIDTRQTLLDEEKNREYIRLVGPVMQQFEGETMAAGAPVETLAGDLRLPPVTVVRFPTMERPHAWYESPEYVPLKQLRLEASTGNLIIFEESWPAISRHSSLP